MPLRWGIAALACLLIIAAVGCSTVTEKPSASVEDTAAQCEQLFRTLDTAVDRAGVRDGGTARIDGFPYLRANRFLASYRDEPMSRRQELWWIDRLKGLDTQARTIELANLPKQDRDELDLSLLSGLSEDRISGKGYGESRLVNHCKNGVKCTKEEHQANRRTEFIIVKM